MLVVIIGDERYEVKGRLAEIIRWLVRRRDEINGHAVGVRFAFRGQHLKAVIEHEEIINGF